MANDLRIISTAPFMRLFLRENGRVVTNVTGVTVRITPILYDVMVLPRKLLRAVTRLIFLSV